MIIAGIRRSNPAIKTQNTEEPVPRLLRDLDILQVRLSQLTGNKTVVLPLTVSSSFVSGIRRVTEEKKYTAAESVERLPILEKVLLKITEFDREVLKKTASDHVSEKNRRKSVSSDLFCLPTHLTVIDRLLDLYRLSQRVDAIKTVVTVSSLIPTTSVSEIDAVVLPSVPIISPDTKLLEVEKVITSQLKTKVGSLTQQLESFKGLLSAAQISASYHNSEAVALQLALSKSEDLRDSLQQTLNLNSVSAAERLAEITKEVGILRNQLQSSESSKSSLEERLEQEVAVNQSIRSALLAGAANLNSDQNTVQIGSSALSGESSAALDSLSAALAAYTARRAKKFDALSATVTSLTAQLVDVNSSKDTLQEDYISLMGANSKLDKEYSSLKQEHEKYIDENKQKIVTQRRNSDEKVASDRLELASQIQMKDEKMKILQASLTASVAQCADLELGSKELNKRIMKLEDESRNQKLEISSHAEDNRSLQNLIETLKNKVREMTGKDASFLDSFEEVMHDEMQAMKWAFESKLKVAKEKADAMSLRHAQEIQRIQERSI